MLVRLPDYANDPDHARWWPTRCGLIAGRYSDTSVIVDTATVNPARLISLPGSIKAKGSSQPDRPWRRVTLDGMGFQVPAAVPAAHTARTR